MDVSVKYKLVESIIKTEDEVVLNEIRALLGIDVEDGTWDGLPDHVKQGIEKAKQQLDNGEGIPHDIIMKEFKAKYGIL